MAETNAMEVAEMEGINQNISQMNRLQRERKQAQDILEIKSMLKELLARTGDNRTKVK